MRFALIDSCAICRLHNHIWTCNGKRRGVCRKKSGGNGSAEDVEAGSPNGEGRIRSDRVDTREKGITGAHMQALRCVETSLSDTLFTRFSVPGPHGAVL